jgi:TonB family protein
MTRVGQRRSVDSKTLNRELARLIGVSYVMRFKRACWLLLVLAGMSFSFGTDEDAGQPCPLASLGSCTSHGPLLTGNDGQPVWLNTKLLIKNSTHCNAPQMPALYRQARIEGLVLVDILVDEKGQVACARLVSGHPLLAGSAIDAARNWTFQPKKRRGRAVSFYGHLRFHFSLGPASKSESPCTVAHG